MADFEIIRNAPAEDGADGCTVVVSAGGVRIGDFYWDQHYSALTLPGSLRFATLESDLIDCLAAISDWRLGHGEIMATIVSPSNEAMEAEEGTGGLQALRFPQRKPSAAFRRAIAGFSQIDFVRFDLDASADVPFSVASDSPRFPDSELIVRVPAGFDWTEDLLTWQVARARTQLQIEPSLFAELNRRKLSRQQVGESW